MTKDEIRRRYLAAIESDIEGAERSCADKEMFEVLLAVCVESQFAYELFHEFSGNLARFDEVCKLFSTMEYCWLDDGDMAFVHATIIGSNSRIYSPNDAYTMEDVFVMNGHPAELRWDAVEKITTKHLSHEYTGLLEYRAIRFDEQGLRFILSLVPRVKQVAVFGNSAGREDAIKYFEGCHAITKKMSDYIAAGERMVHAVKPESKEIMNRSTN